MIQRFLLTHTPLVYLFQSLWRDEAFSVEIANHSIIEILAFSAREYNAPLYYIFLHIWMGFFGPSEFAIRLLSIIPHVLLGVVVFWFGRLFFSKSTALVMMLSVLFNPMLASYAFEARGYSWFALFATVSMVAFLTKRWGLYIAATVAGLYTHAYMLFIPSVQLVFFTYIYYRQKEKDVHRQPFIRALAIVFAFYSAWIPILLSQWRGSGESWIFPIDWQLVLSVLGNVFTSYEGTPAGGWIWTSALSAGLLILFFMAIRKHKKIGSLLFLWIVLPMGTILVASLVKPLYVNRYLIFVAVSESLLAVLGLVSIGGLRVRQLFTVGYFVLLLSINCILASYPRRLDSRAVFHRLSKTEDKQTQLYVDVLLYFDALYYYPYRENIHVYHLPNTHIPSYVGLVLIPDEVIVDRFHEGKRRVVIDGAGNLHEENNL